LNLCDYGCGQEAKFHFKNGKWCCSASFNSCPGQRIKQSEIIQNRTDEEKDLISKKFRGKNNPAYGTTCYWKGKIGPNKGIKRSRESRNKQSKTMKICQQGKGNNNWKGGYAKNNIPTYDQYKEKLFLLSNIRRNKNDKNILEVKCTYCGKWFIPKNTEVHERIRSVEYFGDTELYCSQQCKIECPTYGQQKYPKGFKPSTSREVQPELRQMRFELDNYTCQKCGKHQDDLDVGLHCHHIEGIRWEPLESADLDKVITLCKICHIEVHKKEGCGYHDMKCN